MIQKNGRKLTEKIEMVLLMYEYTYWLKVINYILKGTYSLY